MSREQIARELKEIMIFAEPAKKELFESATEESRLYEDFGLASIGILYVVIAIEETFGVRFTDVSVSDFKTFGSVIDYVEAHIK